VLLENVKLPKNNLHFIKVLLKSLPIMSTLISLPSIIPGIPRSSWKRTKPLVLFVGNSMIICSVAKI